MAGLFQSAVADGGDRMKVLFPFTKRPWQVLQALHCAAPGYEMFDVSGDDTAYWWLLHELWWKGESFVVVEHDVIVRPDSISELEQCPQPWCAFEVKYGDGSTPGLGCAKFTAEAIAAAPDAMAKVATMSDDEHPPMHWCRLDWWLQHKVLPGFGLTQHRHGPPLEHVRDYDGKILPSHDCQSPGRTRTKRNNRQCLKAG